MFRHPFLTPALAGALMLTVPFLHAEMQSGQSAPDCKLSPLGESAEKSLSQYRGKVVYLDFWASWCGPCAQSFPFMNKLHKDLSGKGLQIVGVNLDEDAAEAKGFLTRTPAQFTILADAGGECPQKFDVKAMPSTYLIDRSGVIRQVHLGFKSGESAQLRQQVEALLGEAAPR
ncbi:MAG: TlpA family protein disulfide reductase [Methylococcus sp.]